MILRGCGSLTSRMMRPTLRPHHQPVRERDGGDGGSSSRSQTFKAAPIPRFFASTSIKICRRFSPFLRTLATAFVNTAISHTCESGVAPSDTSLIDGQNDERLMFNTRDARLGVELWIPGAEAKKHFAYLSAQKKDIEDKLDFELDWQELPDAKACRIASWYPHASIEEESRWNEYLNWLTQRLVKMDQVLRPIVKALP